MMKAFLAFEQIEIADHARRRCRLIGLPRENIIRRKTNRKILPPFAQPRSASALTLSRLPQYDTPAVPITLTNGAPRGYMIFRFGGVSKV